jgi:hypothetical protein
VCSDAVRVRLEAVRVLVKSAGMASICREILVRGLWEFVRVLVKPRIEIAVRVLWECYCTVAVKVRSEAERVLVKFIRRLVKAVTELLEADESVYRSRERPHLN